jgi:hypothetical protein
MYLTNPRRLMSKNKNIAIKDQFDILRYIQKSDSKLKAEAGDISRVKVRIVVGSVVTELVSKKLNQLPSQS